MNNERGRHVHALRIASTILASAVAALATALPVAAGDQTFFAVDGGSATCVISADSPTPGPVPRLAIAGGSSLAAVRYNCPDCTGAAPAEPPSFYFKSSAVSRSSGGAPSLALVFDDMGSVQLRPREWSGEWQFVDGAGDNWDSDGGTCGPLSGQSYETVLACHEGDRVNGTYVYTAAGFVTAPYAHFIDDVKIGATTFTSCSIEPAFEQFRHARARRPSDIDVASDMGATGHMALNFTGAAGAAGDTWKALYDATPGDGTRTMFVGGVGVSADVLVGSFNNRKGAGLLALHDPVSGEGLALTVYDAGNSDSLVLSRINGGGKLTPLRTVSLSAGIVESAWYRVTMDVSVSGPTVSITGKVFGHSIPGDPDSPLAGQVGGALTFSGTLGIGPLTGIGGSGEVGVLAAAVSAVVNSSVTNFAIDPDGAGDGQGPEEVFFD